MKIGMRKPSIKKSIKARTTAKAKKAAYNKVYEKTTFSIFDMIK